MSWSAYDGKVMMRPQNKLSMPCAQVVIIEEGAIQRELLSIFAIGIPHNQFSAVEEQRPECCATQSMVSC